MREEIPWALQTDIICRTEEPSQQLESRPQTLGLNKSAQLSPVIKVTPAEGLLIMEHR